ncbi:unnamed protein product [Prorocentrum cordatum]|uniref:CSD domain-containing protein n=1 Tax=Prorocentrum cordatum TaxID=2364126 RepID=A0ABN9XP07_9DINO|nr:unnamed protein product [Polarella glacialis]
MRSMWTSDGWILSKAPPRVLGQHIHLPPGSHFGSSIFGLKPFAQALAGAMSSRGTLKNFFEEKGFGFITPDDGSEDVFAHVKENPALNDCQQGDSVSYDAEYDDRKGKYKAVNLNSGGGGGGGGKGKGKGKDKGGKGGYAPYGKGW